MSFAAQARPAALTLDAAGTLLHPAEPVGSTYARVARRRGHAVDDAALERRVWSAMTELRPLRGDEPGGHAYWRAVVERAIGADDAAVLAELYEYYARAAAWTVSSGARACLAALKQEGVALAVVSNWDTRLGPLLERLGLAACFDAIVVSGQVGFEKPDPRIFALACARLGVDPARTLHVGDSRSADVDGARAAGCQALWFGHDVAGFDELRGVVLAALRD